MKAKVILIVGGISGIGRAVATLAAQRGNIVVVAGRNEHKAEQTLKELQASGLTATFIKTDISDSEQVQHLVTETVRLYGRLDYACNSAALD